MTIEDANVNVSWEHPENGARHFPIGCGKWDMACLKRACGMRDMGHENENETTGRRIFKKGHSHRTNLVSHRKSSALAAYCDHLS